MTTKSKTMLGMALMARLIWKLEHSISTKRREWRSKRPKKTTRENLFWRTSSNERKRRGGRGCKHSQIRGVDRIGRLAPKYTNISNGVRVRRGGKVVVGRFHVIE